MKKPKLPDKIKECRGFLCTRCDGEGTCGSDPSPTAEEFNQIVDCITYLFKELKK